LHRVHSRDGQAKSQLCSARWLLRSQWVDFLLVELGSRVFALKEEPLSRLFCKNPVVGVLR
jgi:hypothetical protein